MFCCLSVFISVASDCFLLEVAAIGQVDVRGEARTRRESCEAGMCHATDVEEFLSIFACMQS